MFPAFTATFVAVLAFFAGAGFFACLVKTGYDSRSRENVWIARALGASFIVFMAVIIACDLVLMVIGYAL